MDLGDRFGKWIWEVDLGNGFGKGIWFPQEPSRSMGTGISFSCCLSQVFLFPVAESLETEGFFHGNEGDEQLGCSLDLQSFSFLLQGHSRSSSKPRGVGAHPGSSQFFLHGLIPCPASPSAQCDDFIQISWKWNLPGIREGFSTRWVQGGCTGSTSRWKIPLWEPRERLSPQNSIKTALLLPLHNSPSLSRRFQRDLPSSHGSAPCPGRG